MKTENKYEDRYETYIVRIFEVVECRMIWIM